MNNYGDIEPDRSKSDYFCRICQSHMNSIQMWENHVSGKRHQKNLKKQDGDVPSKVKSIVIEGERPAIQSTLDRYPRPLLGLSFVSERQSAVPGGENIYQCHLCQGSCTRLNIIEHLETTKHKIFFFKQCDPQTYAFIESMKHISKGGMEALVDGQAADWEKKNGREQMQVEVRKPSDWCEWNPPKISRASSRNSSLGLRNGTHHSSSQINRSRSPSEEHQHSRAAEGSSTSQKPFSMAIAKKNFEKFTIKQKMELLFKLMDTIPYNNLDDCFKALRVYGAAMKICMLRNLRRLPPELMKRAYLDMGERPQKTSDVIDALMKGKKSYYCRKTPFGE